MKTPPGLRQVLVASVALATAAPALAHSAGPPELPNLQLTRLSKPPPTLIPGQRLKLETLVRNAGKANAPQSSARFYLSADQTQSPDDVRLEGAERVSEIGVHEAYAASLRVGVPSMTPAGTCFLVGCADDKHVVEEAREEDNCKSSSKTTSVAPG